MSQMKELYDKVAKDGALQAKYNAIIGDAEKAGEDATQEKLTAFAKEAGYEVSLDEMKTFFKELAENDKGELTDYELDMVAGGKSSLGQRNAAFSFSTLGLGCVVASVVLGSAEGADGIDTCNRLYQ